MRIKERVRGAFLCIERHRRTSFFLFSLPYRTVSSSIPFPSRRARYYCIVRIRDTYRSCTFIT